MWSNWPATATRSSPRTATFKRGWVDLTLRGNKKHQITVRRYFGDDRVERLYDSKCQEELFQAVHRIRPLRGKTPKTILVYSEIPIRDIPVDGVIGPLTKYVDAIRSATAKAPASTSAVSREFSTRIDAHRKMIERKRELLADLAGVDLVGSKFVIRELGKNCN